jgi:hypothetical protein
MLLTHAYAHLLVDMHLAVFAPAFTVSLCDIEAPANRRMRIASVVSSHYKKNIKHKNMSNIEIFEQDLTKNSTKVGKLAILRGGLNTDNPTAMMNLAVSDYVGTTGFNEFVEIYLDNPWVRVIVSGINDLEFKPFTNQRL